MRLTNGGERPNGSDGQHNLHSVVAKQRERLAQSVGKVLGFCEHKQVTSMQLIEAFRHVKYTFPKKLTPTCNRAY